MEILNYGGGRQTVAMAILVAREILPRPDRIVIADTGRENPSTWEYLDRHVRPLLAGVGLEVEIAPHSLATVDLYAHNGDLLLPVYTPTGKFQAYCSNEWKSAVVQRHLRGQGITGANSWIGFAVDESDRIKKPRKGPWTKTYPIVDMMLTKANCQRVIEDFGWPLPVPSSCYMCPNKRNWQWKDVKVRYPEQFAEACRIDEEIRAIDIENGNGGVWLHKSRVPLREADLDAPDGGEPSRQCGLGTCFV